MNELEKETDRQSRGFSMCEALCVHYACFFSYFSHIKLRCCRPDVTLCFHLMKVMPNAVAVNVSEHLPCSSLPLTSEKVIGEKNVSEKFAQEDTHKNITFCN